MNWELTALIAVPIAIAAFAGVIHNTVKVTQLETQMKALWEWWVENHRDQLRKP